MFFGCFLHPTAVARRTLTTKRFSNFALFIYFLGVRPVIPCTQSYLAQLGCDLLPEIWAVSLTRLVGTSSKDRVRLLPFLRVKMTVREFGAQEGSSPETSACTEPPWTGTTQMVNPARGCDVKTMFFPSGDQSGSLGLGSPPVFSRVGVPPLAEMMYKPRRSLGRDA